MDDDECMICLEDMKSNIAILSCGHRYHFNCITLWANKKKDLRHICTICPEENEIINVIESNTTDYKVNYKKYIINEKRDEPKSKQCIIL